MGFQTFGEQFILTLLRKSDLTCNIGILQDAQNQVPFQLISGVD